MNIGECTRNNGKYKKNNEKVTKNNEEVTKNNWERARSPLTPNRLGCSVQTDSQSPVFPWTSSPPGHRYTSRNVQ